jgi:hypothetical protein
MAKKWPEYSSQSEFSLASSVAAKFQMEAAVNDAGNPN